MVSSVSVSKIGCRTVMPSVISLPLLKHIFVCPSLMKGYWLKMLGKVADSVFSLKACLSILEEELSKSLKI